MKKIFILLFFLNSGCYYKAGNNLKIKDYQVVNLEKKSDIYINSSNDNIYYKQYGFKTISLSDISRLKDGCIVNIEKGSNFKDYNLYSKIIRYP